jgi:hypothetical protein
LRLPLRVEAVPAEDFRNDPWRVLHFSFPTILVFAFAISWTNGETLRAVATQQTRTFSYLVCLMWEGAIAVTPTVAALTVVAAATSL